MLKNRFVNRAKFSESTFCELLRCFASDFDATQIASQTGLNRNTVNRIMRALRERIAEIGAAEAAGEGPPAEGAVKLFPLPFAGTDAVGLVKTWIGSTGKVRVDIMQNATLPEPRKTGGAEIAGDSRSADARERNGAILDEFWAFAGGRLTKFRGMPPSTYQLHLKECVFRFNQRHDDLYRSLLELLALRPLF